MGLDIAFTTRGNGKKEIWTLRNVENKSEEQKKAIKRYNELTKKIRTEEEQKEILKISEFIEEQVDSINKENGIVELYFRKVPRMVYLGLLTKSFQARKSKDTDVSQSDKLFAMMGNWMINSKEEEKEAKEFLTNGLTLSELQDGTFNLKYFKDTMKSYFKNKSILNDIVRSLGSSSGLFWGEDSWTSDKELKKEVKKFFNEIKKLQNAGKLPEKDEEVVIKYSFFW